MSELSGTENSTESTTSLTTEAATTATTTEAATTEGTTTETTTEAPKVEASTEFVPLARDAITFPEGLTYADETVTGFLDLMNNQELTPAERAQGLIDLQAKVAQEASEANSSAWNTLQETWQGQAKADPEFGGDKFQATMTNVGKLVQEYGNDALREALDTTGAGNHPEVIRFLSKLSSLLTEGGPATGTPKAGGDTTPAQRLFPSMN